MSTVCTKHKPRREDPDSGTTHGLPVAEVPVRRSKLTSEGHSIVFGAASDADRFVSLKAKDYGGSAKKQGGSPPVDPRALQRSRVHDMQQKHFVFGHAAPTLESELRGSLRPPSAKELVLSRAVCPIGGPNNKGASNIFVSSTDIASWTTGMTSTSRHDYKPAPSAAASTRGSLKQRLETMRSAHFEYGQDRPDWTSTSRQAYCAEKLPATAGVQPAAAPVSSVPLNHGRSTSRNDGCETTQHCYGSRVNEYTPEMAGWSKQVADLGRQSHMVLGYDRARFDTENRKVYREPRYVPRLKRVHSNAPPPPFLTPFPYRYAASPTMHP